MRRYLIFFIAALLIVSPALAQTISTPPPLPLPTREMYQQLATANAQLATLPPNLDQANGQSLLSNENGAVIFGYIKWLVSPAAADEWAGPFAGIFQHIGIGIAMTFSLMGVYGVVYVIANIGGWIGWLLESARKALDLVFQAAQAAPVLLILVVVLFIAFTIFGQKPVMDWFDQQLNSVFQWLQRIISQISGGAS